MKVLSLEDVYKLGRAGDVKRVADGYGRNYLIPQGLAVLATPGALKQVEHIRARAETSRAALNQEMSGIAERLAKLTLAFPARAGETGKLYGSITSQMIADSIQDKLGLEIDRRQLDAQPLRTLGEHNIHVRLTIDLVPEVRVIVYREGETVDLGEEEVAAEAVAEAEVAEESAPEAEVAEVSAPEAEVAEVSEPEAEVAEVSEPEAEVAEVSEPEAEEAEVPEPDAEVIEEAQPEAEVAEVPEPEAEVTEEAQPEAEVAEVPEPEAEVAEVPEPEAEVTEEAQPEAEVAEVPEPEAEVAEESEPEAEVAEEAQPDTEAPAKAAE